MKELVNIGNWLYNYSTDFCINMSYLLGIDYVTFGSLFFGFLMNGIMVALILLNIIVEIKRRRKKQYFRNRNL